jgi:arylsulfatase A-like enzyme
MQTGRPNIVFLFADDQRFDTIHALGNEEIHTPHLDRLVARGTSFTHAHIPCGTVGAVCMPSRAMLHTGRTLFHLERSGQQIPTEHTTLGEALRRSGYRTFGAGKWHNGREAYHRSFTDGAEIFFGGMADHWNVPMYNFDPTGQYAAKCPFVPNPQASNEVRYRSCDHIGAGQHSTDLLGQAAVEFINSYDGEAPFFMYVAFLAPHDPRTMPRQYLEMYDPNNVSLPPSFLAEHPFDNGALRIRDELLAPFPRTPEAVQQHTAEYYAMITHLDAQVGRVLAALEDKGVMDNTIIVYAADNGLAVGRHGLFGKQNCYDHSVRVPLIFAGPGIPANRRVDAFAYLLDVFPTLCELTDTPVPASVEGKSLSQVVAGSETEVRDTLYFAYAHTQRAVRDRCYKLIEYVTQGCHHTTQLFNLEADPWELHNLAGEPEHQQALGGLRQEMLRYRQSWGDVDSEWGRQFWRATAF